MFGKNKIASIIAKEQSFFQIVDIFKTIQGEGFFAGYPAIFVRLGGCNLACDFCDTEFDEYEDMELEMILSKISGLSYEKQKNRVALVVITGGEPLRQNITLLCKKLITDNYKVQIETNGTVQRKLPKKTYIMCSPKMIKNKYNITKELIEYADAFKFIVRAKGENYTTVPNFDNVGKNIYVQPMDEYNEQKNKKNLDYAISLAVQNNYILSLQQHKITGMQ